MELPSIAALERATLTTLPAPRVAYDGAFVIRAFHGGTGRGNAASSLDPALDPALAERIARIEARYRALGLEPRFRSTPLDPPGLEALLRAGGYAEDGETVVLITPTAALAASAFGGGDRRALRCCLGRAGRGDAAAAPGFRAAVGAAAPSGARRTSASGTRKNFTALVAAAIPERVRGQPIELWWQDRAHRDQRPCWPVRHAEPHLGGHPRRATHAHHLNHGSVMGSGHQIRPLV